jgi:hypothetical protein
MHKNDVYYRGKNIAYLPAMTRKFFNLKNSRTFKYVITIVVGSMYRVAVSDCHEDYDFYDSTNDCEYQFWVCQEYFGKVFPALDTNKKYDITVKKVRK